MDKENNAEAPFQPDSRTAAEADGSSGQAAGKAAAEQKKSLKLPGEDLGSGPNMSISRTQPADANAAAVEDSVQSVSTNASPFSEAVACVSPDAIACPAALTDTNPSAEAGASAVPAGGAKTADKKASTVTERGAKSDPKKSKGLLRETIELILSTLVLLIVIRGTLAEARYIPSGSMEPTLQVNDRLLVEKISGWMMRPVERGDILVFYPPPIELGGKDISYSPLHVLGRLTGLPCFPMDTAYIKRVVGLPGEQIRVERGVGVFVDDQFLPEPYLKERPNYELRVLGDIGGRNAAGQFIKPYGDSSEPILVPPGKLLMMGDNRNNSEDGHVFGFVDQKRVIGKSCLVFWRLLPGEPYKKAVTSAE
jgi:signal peptidase I